jgi:hypothetical protein
MAHGDEAANVQVSVVRISRLFGWKGSRDLSALLDWLKEEETLDFWRMITGSESWFYFRY